MCEGLVSTGIVDDIGTRYEGETYAKGDLASLDDMMRVLDLAVMGACADEGRFEKLLAPIFELAAEDWHEGKAASQGLSNHVWP